MKVFYHRKMSLSKKLIEASENGDIKSVQSLLANKEIDINCKGILNQKHS